MLPVLTCQHDHPAHSQPCQDPAIHSWSSMSFATFYNLSLGFPSSAQLLTAEKAPLSCLGCSLRDIGVYLLTYLPICEGVLVKLTRLSALDLGSLSILSTANLPYQWGSAALERLVLKAPVYGALFLDICLLAIIMTSTTSARLPTSQLFSLEGKTVIATGGKSSQMYAPRVYYSVPHPRMLTLTVRAYQVPEGSGQRCVWPWQNQAPISSRYTRLATPVSPG